MPSAEQGELIKLTKAVSQRVAFFGDQNSPGETTISLLVGTQLRAATLSFNGSVFAHCTSSSGQALVVPLHEGEWVKAG